jgi:protein-S-isoprenylcysteine O-methyltransferase Ste14
MPPFIRSVFALLWLIWAAYWWSKSRGVKETVRKESILSRLSYLILVALAFSLLWVPRVPLPFFEGRFLPLGGWPVWAGIGVALTFLGLAFSVWAREHLGRNWSAVVTVKRDHELITTGPYAWVRHPIYSGLVLAALGQAIARGQWIGLLGVAILLGAFWRKARVEERWIREQFGSAYENYSRQVRAIIPFVL